MEKTDSQKRKIFHGFCIAILTALFIVLVAAAFQKGDADEAALLHTTGCGIIMVMNILLAVCYCVGHYTVTAVQDRIYMLLLILIMLVLSKIGQAIKEGFYWLL